MTVLELDIRTLSFMTVLISFLYGVGLLVFSFRNNDYDGISSFGISLLIMSLGFLLMVFRGKIPDWLSIVSANGLILAAFILYNRSIAAFRGSPLRNCYIGAALLAIQPFFFCYYTYVEPSVNARIIYISASIGLTCMLCVWDILRGTKDDNQVASWMTTLPFLCAGAFFIFRTLWAIEETMLRGFMHAGTIHQLAFITINILILTSSFGLLWMVSKRLECELMEQARVDTLTRVYNRRALSEIGPREYSRARRHGLPFSVIMSDIDHFKIVNDTHGHQVGDIVLANFAKLFTGQLRKQDFIIRFGGEEFLVLLPDTLQEQAIQVAEKLRLSVMELPLCPTPEVTATASFGVATLSADENWEEMISRADAALYEAKGRGRNKVVGR